MFKDKLSLTVDSKGAGFQCFKIKQDSKKINFLIPETSAAIEIQNFLKRKLNFSGFHATFQKVKIIGSGNFASVFNNL